MMRHLRVLTCTVATLISLFAFAATATIVIDTLGRVDKDCAFYAQFIRAAAATRDFEKANGRRPTREELNGSPANAFPLFDFDGYDPEDADFFARIGKPPTGGFVLSFWRGEWFEHYASWNGATTLLTTRGAYVEATWPTAASFLLIAVIAGATAWSIRSRRAGKKFSGQRPSAATRKG